MTRRAVARVLVVLAAVVGVLLLGRSAQVAEDPSYLKAAVGEADGLLLRRRAGERVIEAGIRDRDTLDELAMVLEFDPETVAMRPSGRSNAEPIAEIFIRRDGRTVEAFTLADKATLWYGPDRAYQVKLVDQAFGEAISEHVDWP